MKKIIGPRRFGKLPVLIGIGLLAAILTGKALADLAKVDGFCAMDVLAMERAELIDPLSSKGVTEAERLLYAEAVKRAKALYATEDVYYSETLEILVHKGGLLFGEDAYGNDERTMGAKVSLWLNGEEDVITYYFYLDADREDNELLLKMYLHDEQSATSYWTCEF